MTPTPPPPPDWNTLRDDFPILHQTVHGAPLIYFDNAATTQKPRAVLAALGQYYERDNANVHRGIHELSNRATRSFEAARTRAARFLNAGRPEEIVFTRGTTEGINLVAHAWGTAHLRRGDTVLLTEMEHHSNLVPWQLLAERTGVKLAFLPVHGDQGQIDWERLEAWLTPDVKLLAFTHISNSLGTINPAADICALARRHHVATLVDAAQSAGHRPIDVQDIGCDFLALSAHKMCGPTGFGVLYGRAERLETMPPFQGGGEMILSVDFDASTYKPAPHRFEAGTPDISGAVGLRAAMDYLDTVGRDRIAAHDVELGAYAYARLAEVRNLRLFGPSTGRAGLVSFVMKGVHAHDLVTVADQFGIALRGGHHCNQPLMKKLGVESTARASFYLYNTPGEIDRLVDVLRDIQKFFRV
ncbi:MAG: cysteine desulfurase [Verrucomicrobia bacterium]|nr:cysteine desulfurase [Verrucomicrobiota bacterium]